jgi:hypothetical protein
MAALKPRVKSSTGLAVDFFSISNAKDQKNEMTIFDFADKPKIATRYLQDSPRRAPWEGFADASRIVELG